MLEKRAQTRAREILAHRWGSIDRLLGGQKILHYRLRESQFFLEAMQEAFAYRFLDDPAFARLCHECGFLPQHLTELEQTWQIPRQGWSGSQEGSARAARRLGLSLQRIFGDLGCCSLRRTHYLWVGEGFSPGVVRGIQSTSKVARSYRFPEVGPDLLKILFDVGPNGPPVRLITTDPAALTRALIPYQAELAELSPNSQLVTWTHTPQPTNFGIKQIELLQVSQHPLPLAGCKAGHFHLSRLARALVRADGSQIYVSPLSDRTLPLHAEIRTVINWQSDCSCGRTSPWIGRRPG